MIWFLFQKLGFYLFLFLTIKYILFKKYNNLLELYFWGLVFANCFQFFITIWFPTKIISLGMLIVLLGKNKILFQKPRIISYILFLVLFLLVTGNLIAIFFEGDLKVDFSPVKRLVLQNFTYIITLLLLLYPVFLNPNRLLKIYSKYCSAMEVAIFFGLVHYFFNLLNLPFAPILRVEGVSEHNDVIAIYGGNIVKRIYGFSGEPKNLGFAIAPYLFMSMFMFYKGVIRRSYRYHLGFFALGLWVVYNTFSSSTYITIFICFIAMAMVFKFRIKPRLLTGIVLLITGVLTYNLIIYSNQSSGINKSNVLKSLYERSFGRASEELINERQETIIWNTFKNERLIHLLFGYGPGQYIFHVEGQTKDNSLIPVQSGLIRTLVDFGFLGVLFFIYYGFAIIKYLIASNKKNNYQSSAFLIAAFCSYIGSFTYGNFTTSFIYFTIGVYLFQTSNPKFLTRKLKLES